MHRADGTGLEREVYLWDLLTLVQDCVVAPVGPVAATLVTQLEERGFDDAPVAEPRVGGGYKIIGLTETLHLRALHDAHAPLERADAAIRLPSTTVKITIDELLLALAAERALLVTRIEQDDDGTDDNIVGLLTFSDLNRHPFRAVLYALLASLEAALARLVERRFTNPQTWIGLLDEDQQAWVLGFWELSKRRNVDVGPIAATMLSHVINVVAKTKALRGELGYASRASYDDATGHIPDLRNKVMHPVRPLILDHVEVVTLRKTLRSIEELTNHAEVLNGSQARGVYWHRDSKAAETRSGPSGSTSG